MALWENHKGSGGFQRKNNFRKPLTMLNLHEKPYKFFSRTVESRDLKRN